jgi:hypothetical protein
MSSPVREFDGYAPRWARLPAGSRAGANVEDAARDLTPARDLPPDFAADLSPDLPTQGFPRAPEPPPAGAMPAREPASPPWKRKKAQPIFEGDVAIKELRARLALAPDEMPEPPPHRPVGGPAVAVVVRLLGVMGLAGAGALGFLWITAPRAVPPEPQQAAASAVVPVIVSTVAVSAVPQGPVITESLKSDRAPQAAPSGASWSVADYARDLADRAATPSPSLAPSLAPAPAPFKPATVDVLPAAEMRIAPPAVVPRAAGPLASVVAAPDREENAALLARGRAYIAEGDVAAARLVLRRAVERGDSQAALALGGTYDPTVLKRLGVVSFLADATQAREWYSKAAELGSTDAPLRIEQLAQVDR